MLRKYLLSAAIWALWLVFSTQAIAIDVSIVNADTTWTTGNTYVIKNNITVGNGITLTIQPGVVVEFGGAFELQIHGRLQAVGSVSQPIIFRRASGVTNWRRIVFYGPQSNAQYSGEAYVSGSGSTLQYADISGAGSPAIGNNVRAEAAVFIWSGAHPYIANVTIRDGIAPAIHAIGIDSTFKIVDSVLQNNVINDPNTLNTSDKAAGVYVAAAPVNNNSDVTLSGNTIANNTVLTNIGQYAAGGIGVNGIAVLSVRGNTISGNRSIVAGGGISIVGLSGTAADHVISNNTIANNYAQERGGGTFVVGSELILTDNIFEGNSAGESGGALAIGLASEVTPRSVTVSGNMFIANVAEIDGGGIDSLSGDHSIQNNVLYANQAVTGKGAGIHLGGGDVQINNNMIAGNFNSKAGAAIDSLAIGSISNNTFAFNDSDTSIMELKNTVQANALQVQGNSIVWNSVSNINLSIVNISNIASALYSPLFNNNNIYSNGVMVNGQSVYSVRFLANTLVLDARNNWWGTSVREDIALLIDGFIDDIGNITANVDVTGYQLSPRMDVPPSPPVNVAAARNGNTITVNWDVNLEADISGYNVYASERSGLDYGAPKGNTMANSYSFQVPTSATYYIAVTAYDINYNVANDSAATRVNDNQMNGTESWYSEQVIATGTSSGPGSGSGGSGGGSVGLFGLVVLLMFARRRIAR